MTKYFFTLLAFFALAESHAQTSGTQTGKSNYSMPSRDYVMIQFGYEGWNGAPDSIKIGGIGRAFNAYLCYDFPLAKSNFSFAAGAGIGVSNIYLKNQMISLTDTSRGSQILFLPENYDYKKFKLTTAYLEAPFELRYFGNKANRNKGFKASVGLKVGALISTHTKGKRTLSGKPVIDKESAKRYIETVRYSATMRLGYGNFSLYGQYSIGNLFKVGAGPENIRPYQIGLCITGL